MCKMVVLVSYEMMREVTPVEYLLGGTNKIPLGIYKKWKGDGLHLEASPSFHWYNRVDMYIVMPEQHAQFQEAATAVSGTI